MKNSIIQATVAPVKVGHLVFEGLMDETGRFSVAVPQLCNIFQFDTNQASRYIKSLLGKGFQFDKRKTKLNPKAINAVGLPDFERLLRKLDRAGNSIAQSICDDLIGLSLQQLFCDAFEIEFNKRDREAWLTDRQKSKQAFWTLGDAIKAHIESRPDKSRNYRTFIYSNCQNAINRGLFGKCASDIREELNVPDLLRDHYGEAALRRIDLVQAVAAANIVNANVEPLDAIKSALAMFSFEVMDYRG